MNQTVYPFDSRMTRPRILSGQVRDQDHETAALLRSALLLGGLLLALLIGAGGV